MHPKSNGKKHFNTIIRLGKQFIPGEGRWAINTLSYAASVRSSYIKDDDYYYNWEGSLSIRVQNTMIYIHNTSMDPGLEVFEKKLVKIKEVISTFVEKSLERYALKRSPKDTPLDHINERVWLNTFDTENLATGYIAYRIDEYGLGQLVIADCNRSITFWTNVFWDSEKGKVNPKKFIRDLLKINDGIDKAIENLNKLRAEFEQKTGQ